MDLAVMVEEENLVRFLSFADLELDFLGISLSVSALRRKSKFSLLKNLDFLLNADTLNIVCFDSVKELFLIRCCIYVLYLVTLVMSVEISMERFSCRLI